MRRALSPIPIQILALGRDELLIVAQSERFR